MKIKKTYILFVLAGMLMIACNNNSGELSGDVVRNPVTASGEADLGELPVMEFRETLHDFGTVIEGEKVTYNFKFTNTGGSDLLLSSVSASCGCTATNYTKDPVKPGEDGVVTITFDSRRRKGFQNKAVTVSANTQPNKVILRVKAKVLSPKDL
jgi:hypothetical protein